MHLSFIDEQICLLGGLGMRIVYLLTFYFLYRIFIQCALKPQTSKLSVGSDLRVVLICRATKWLHYRQTDAIYLLVDVESIYIGHAADIVYYCHDAGLEVVGVDFVLAAHSAYKLL